MTVGIIFALAVCIPYLYYATLVHNYIHDHASTEAGPNFDQMPQLSNFWITGVSGAI